MNLIVLRGKADRPNEIAFNGIYQEEDMWTLLFHRMLQIDKHNDMGYVVYWGHKRHQYMDFNFWVIWTPDLAKYKPDIEPDIIFARGGFKEYVPFLKRYKDKFKIYYGAGVRYIPRDGIKYNLILVDSHSQIRAVKKEHPDTPVEVFFKPAPENIFCPKDVRKRYDCCYVALIPNDSRKRVKWVYRQVPKDISILQLGDKPSFRVPKNVKVKKVPKAMMADMMCQCHVGIAPYTSDDSGPRVLPEFLACGMPVVVLPDLMFWQERHGKAVMVETADRFWKAVRQARTFGPEIETAIRSYYLNHLSLDCASRHLREVVFKHYAKQ